MNPPRAAAEGPPAVSEVHRRAGAHVRAEAGKNVRRRRGKDLQLAARVTGADADVPGIGDDHPLSIRGHEAQRWIRSNRAAAGPDVQEPCADAETRTAIPEVEGRAGDHVETQAGEDVGCRRSEDVQLARRSGGARGPRAPAFTPPRPAPTAARCRRLWR